MDYKEQIKDPRWQRRRLEILSRDNFACQICGDTDNTLHVHHLAYEQNKKIWEYDDWQLILLCEKCHEDEHKNALNDILETIRSLQKMGITLFEISSLLWDINISIYLEHDDAILKVTGNDGSYFHRENEILALTQRRIKAKEKLYKENERKRKDFREKNKDIPF